MSIQAECREAMNRLADQGQVFTEIDVANEARRTGWATSHLERAMKDAYNVLAGDYKKGKLVRYGPVTFMGNEDYARRATKIVYADAAKGPDVWETPNGAFPRLFADNDALARAGRKVGTDRDDTKPWSVQAPVKRVEERELKGPPVDVQPFMKRIQQLEDELARERKRQPVAAVVTNGNGNGNGKHVDNDHALNLPVTIAELAEILEPKLFDRLVERATESVRESLAEKLIA